MTNAPELKPCPFCGGEADHSMGERGDGTPWPYIECVDCGASTEPDVWNRRADLCQPKVKPLVWVEATGRDNPAMIEAKTAAGKYEILQDPTSGWLFDVWFYGETEFHIGSFADDEAAKAAAEAHYTAWALDLHKQLFEVTE